MVSIEQLPLYPNYLIFSQTLENDTVSSVGSHHSSNSTKREQATSVSFINIPHKKTAATSTTSPPVTRSRATSKGKLFDDKFKSNFTVSNSLRVLVNEMCNQKHPSKNNNHWLTCFKPNSLEN